MPNALATICTSFKSRAPSPSGQQNGPGGGAGAVPVSAIDGLERLTRTAEATFFFPGFEAVGRGTEAESHGPAP